ncbi:hypothetical protein OQJ46_01465 [Microbulbifer thermotolerans]|uniref:hypothetical protein n=1 Tax=Microbulbifer thermotolerans TaxID=252514 RepID=UPI0008EE1967|nr:hypothetical protein [Microbulbifer thermotolerans]MCX2781655.1 hypothetical protein [Microbulbifer thermotolerans]MCX2835353.1 hypothetical protein [Microbulbifer thermotolerans]SFB66494.1 hypothetical protein SAMN05660479_00002 [Microbulbifer thermotolerans]
MINLNINHVIFLKRKKYPIQYTLLGSSIRLHLDTMSATEPFRLGEPITAMLSHVENGI